MISSVRARSGAARRQLHLRLAPVRIGCQHFAERAIPRRTHLWIDSLTPCLLSKAAITNESFVMKTQLGATHRLSAWGFILPSVSSTFPHCHSPSSLSTSSCLILSLFFSTLHTPSSSTILADHLSWSFFVEIQLPGRTFAFYIFRICTQVSASLSLSVQIFSRSCHTHTQRWTQEDYAWKEKKSAKVWPTIITVVAVLLEHHFPRLTQTNEPQLMLQFLRLLHRTEIAIFVAASAQLFIPSQSRTLPFVFFPSGPSPTLYR